ncbi:hypothetical protein, partial [Kitasatospora phosalacinea]|uniref:hypothetical protein n=1 Tax=Kitasatospora phosalacinea TaxID=2065 RepID=UPI0018FEF44D
MDEVGRGRGEDTYAGVELDTSAHRVKVYVTAPASADVLLAEAKRRHPGIDLSLVRVVAAKYSKKQLHDARKRLVTQGVATTQRITSIAVAVDGSGLEVATGAAAASAARSVGPVSSASTADSISEVAGVPVTLSTDGQVSRPASRYADIPGCCGYYAGGFISLGGWNCTTGIPVRSNSRAWSGSPECGYVAVAGRAVSCPGGEDQLQLA